MNRSPSDVNVTVVQDDVAEILQAANDEALCSSVYVYSVDTGTLTPSISHYYTFSADETIPPFEQARTTVEISFENEPGRFTLMFLIGWRVCLMEFDKASLQLSIGCSILFRWWRQHGCSWCGNIDTIFCNSGRHGSTLGRLLLVSRVAYNIYIVLIEVLVSCGVITILHHQSGFSNIKQLSYRKPHHAFGSIVCRINIPWLSLSQCFIWVPFSWQSSGAWWLRKTYSRTENVHPSAYRNLAHYDGCAGDPHSD